jgi:hypothetical protein
MAKFIVFNTLKQAEHWMKHKNKMLQPAAEQYDSEYFEFYSVGIKQQVVRVSGWRCGCGCDQGSTHAQVVGRIKNA